MKYGRGEKVLGMTTAMGPSISRSSFARSPGEWRRPRSGDHRRPIKRSGTGVSEAPHWDSVPVPGTPFHMYKMIVMGNQHDAVSPRDER